MAKRGDIIWLGVSSGVMGALVGGLMLGIGMAMVIEQKYAGFIFIIPGAPVAGLAGWLMARRLAAQFPK
jgi:hypothetical protein